MPLSRDPSPPAPEALADCLARVLRHGPEAERAAFGRLVAAARATAPAARAEVRRLAREALGDRRTKAKLVGAYLLQFGADTGDVEALIDLLDAPNTLVRMEARNALFVLTGALHSDDARTWRAWWAEHRASWPAVGSQAGTPCARDV